MNTMGEKKLPAMIALHKTLSHLEIGFESNLYSDKSPIIVYSVLIEHLLLSMIISKNINLKVLALKAYYLMPEENSC